MDNSLRERLEHLEEQLESTKTMVTLTLEGKVDVLAISHILAKLNYALELCAANGDFDFEILGEEYIGYAQDVVEDGKFEHQSMKLMMEMAKGENFR